MPDERDQPPEVERVATLYHQAGESPDQPDRITVDLDGNREELDGFEVVTVRDRTGRAGVHHRETTIRRIIEGR